MKNKARFLGHPIHPTLVVFPVALFTTSLLFDVLYLITRDQIFPVVTYYMIATGILSGLLAAVFGVIDWLGLPPRSRSWSFALGHGIGNILVVMLFTLNWMLRRGGVNLIPDNRMWFLSIAGVALLHLAWRRIGLSSRCWRGPRRKYQRLQFTDQGSASSFKRRTHAVILAPCNAESV